MTPADSRRTVLGGAVLGVGLVVAIHHRLLSSRYVVPWDASDFMLPVMQWFASAIRAGESPAWIPYLAGGFPAARELQFGYMGPLHPILALLFVGTTRMTSIFVLAIYAATFLGMFAIARRLRLSAFAALWIGLWVAGSGFWLGNGSHLPILIAATASLYIVLGLLGLAEDRRWAPLCTAAAWVFGINGGYPTTLLFGGQIAGLIAIGLLIARRLSWRALRSFVLASALGIAAGAPTLVAAKTWFDVTPRARPLTPEQAMRVSTHPQTLLSFFRPLITVEQSCGPHATDPTLDRFHLTFAAIGLLAVAIAFVPRWRATDWFLLALLLLGIDFTLGRYGIIRPWLAGNFAWSRLNQYPPADHAWLIPAAAALGLGRLVHAAHERWLRGRPAAQLVVSIALAADVIVVATCVSRELVAVRAWPPWNPPPAPDFKVIFTADEQAALDAGRLCNETTMRLISNTPAMPDRFLPWGFVSAAVKAYEDDFFARRLDWICGPGKLRDAQTARPVAYRLVRYAPTEVRIVVPAEAPRDLVWNDADDGWWSIEAAGRNVKTADAPSGLRRFRLPSGEYEVRMHYRPRIPFWTGWITAAAALLIAAGWCMFVRAPRAATASPDEAQGAGSPRRNDRSPPYIDNRTS